MISESTRRSFVKQEGNTLRDVTNSYFTDFQVIKIILIADILAFCSKFGSAPVKLTFHCNNLINYG